MYDTKYFETSAALQQNTTIKFLVQFGMAPKMYMLVARYLLEGDTLQRLPKTIGNKLQFIVEPS